MKRIDKVTLQFEIEEQRKGDALKEINEELRKQIEIVDDLEKQKREAEKKYAGNPEADELKRINSLYEQELKKLSDLDKKKSEHINSTKAQTLSLSQLQQELKTYNNILAHLTPGSKAFGDTQEYVNKLKERIKELRSGVSETKSGLLKFADDFNKVAFAFTNIFNVKDKIVGVFRAVTSYLDPMAEMAMEAEGVEQAFRRIDQPGLLDNLRQATHGTVNDLELMKQAVKFKDFNLPVDQLGTYLAFAQQKAKDTGESIDYLVNSIVTGLGRQSPQILDNLGLSAKQISEEAKRSGDFFGAVAKIVGQNMAQAGEYVETASDRAAQATARLQNAQVELGRAWLPVKEQIDDTYNSLQVNVMNAVRWIIQHRDVIKTLVATLGTLVAVQAVHYAWTQRQLVIDRLHAALTVVRNKALELHTILTATDTTATQKLTAATQTLNATLHASPWTWVATILAGVVAITMTLRNRTSELTETTRMMNGIQSEAAAKAQQQREKVEALISVAQDETVAMTKRLEATKQLNSIIPGYNAQIDQTTGKYSAAKEKLDEYLNSLTRQYEIEGAKGMFEELGRQLAEQNIKLKEAKDNLETAQELNKAASGLNMSSSIGTLSYTKSTWGEENAVASAEKALNTTKAKIEKLKQAYGIDLFSDITSGNNPDNNPDNNPGNNTKTDPYQTDLEALERNHRQALNVLKQAYADGKKTEQEYTQDTYTLQQARLQARLALQQKYGKDTTETEGQIIDATIAEAKRKQDAADKAQQKQKNDQQEQLRALDEGYKSTELRLTQQRLNGEIQTEEEYDNRKIDAEIAYLRQRIALLKQFGLSAVAEEQKIAELQLQQLTQQQKQQLDTLQKQAEAATKAHDYDQALTLQRKMLDAGLITQQQYEQAKTDLTRKAEEDRQKIREAFDQQAQQLMQASSQLFQAMQQREESRVQKKYKALIDTARKNGQDTTKLEEQQEEELLEIRKRYADKQFALTVLQIIADTARGIQKIWAEWGWNPPVAAGLTATTAAVGAIQLATAKIQRDQAAGLYTGGYSDEARRRPTYQEGYTGDGDPSEVAGVIPVHRREFVINHQALRIPAIQRVADIIDGAQQRRNYNIQDTTRQLRQALLPPEAGLAQGGYNTKTAGTQEAPAGNSPYGNTIAPLLEENNRLLERFLASGLTILQLRREIRKQERLEQNVSR